MVSHVAEPYWIPAFAGMTERANMDGYRHARASGSPQRVEYER